MTSGDAAPTVDQQTVSPARRWNYWLGGKDHFQIDRESGDRIADAFPAIRIAAQQGRAFHNRVIRHLAGEAGIRQFIDIGTGLPAPDNTHEVARAIAPESKVVYVDNDPMVLTHARALMVGGTTTYVNGDLRHPGTILDSAELKETIDLSRPVAILLIAVLHFIKDDEQAREVVRELLAAAAPGSFLVATNSTKDFIPPQTAAMYDAMLATGHVDAWPRDKDCFGRFFDGLELIDPGVVPICDWRPDSDERPTAAETSMYGAVGRKPR
ncbi:SAM-dependent methyltransferase [Actinoplanes sp. GCM10030250]|uniref:SAM-dependent methyltransferase n=1 Tax=Actinoplanes sp. GCM10030250 TaxID=3273376 RepID=UPI00361DCC53